MLPQVSPGFRRLPPVSEAVKDQRRPRKGAEGVSNIVGKLRKVAEGEVSRSVETEVHFLL